METLRAGAWATVESSREAMAISLRRWVVKHWGVSLREALSNGQEEMV